MAIPNMERGWKLEMLAMEIEMELGTRKSCV
jgi:hypothetical protein